MAIDGGERTCGVHELICIRKVSPEAVGFLSAVGVFIILLLILFLYINKKMCFENVGGFPDLSSRYNTRKNSQDKLYNRNMAFFKNFQQNLNLPSMSSLVGTLSNAVEDLTSAVGDVSYTVADSVTEQVTNMINSLRTDDTAKTQEDKFEVGKDENIANNDIEKYRREKQYDSEEKHKQSDSLKQNRYNKGEINYGIDKMQRQLNAIEPNELNDSEVRREMNNSIKHGKHKRQTGNKYLENNTLPKVTGEHYSTCRTEESLNEKPIKKLHVELEQSKDPLQRRVKKKSPEVNFMDAKEAQSIASKNLEANEVQTSKLPEPRSKIIHGAHEVKSKKQKIISECPRQPVTELKENASSTLSKEGAKQKHKESEIFSKEVSSKKTPAKDNSYINKEQHGSSSESEDEALGKYHEALSRNQSSRPPAGDNRQQKNYIWETRQKYSPLSAEYDGYSSEASIDEGKINEECSWLHLIREGGNSAHPRTLVAEKAETNRP